MSSVSRLAVLALVLAVAVSGCGSNFAQTLALPDRLYGVDGQVFTLEDLEDIANDNSLSDEEKMDAFRELGIEDPDLLEALLDL